MRTLLLILLALTSFKVSGQHVVIQGHIPDGNENLPVFMYKPIGKFYNGFLKDSVTSIASDNFSFNFPLHNPAFVTLESKLFRCTMFLEPGDSINIWKKKENNELFFSGNNAAGHHYLNKNKPFNASKVDEYLTKRLNEILSKELSLDFFEAMLSRNISWLDSLDKIDTITGRYKEALTYFAIASSALWTANFMIINLDTTTVEKRPKAERDKMIILLNKLYERYDPFDLRYAYQPDAFNSLVMKFNAISMGAVPAKKNRVPNLTIFGPQYERYAYAPKEYLEILFGNNLLINLEMNVDDQANLLDRFNFLCSNFPNSPYIPLIRNLITSADLDNNKNPNGQLFGKLTTGTNRFELISEAGSYTTIDDLIANQFKGKPVFIDLWATWCSPCKAELQYEESMSSFLQDKGIEMLYITFDYPNYEQKWKKFIEDNRLHGYHYFPDRSFKDRLAKDLNTKVLGIPRYLLYNAAGKLTIEDAYRPSTDSLLKNQITQALNKDK